MTSYTWEVEEAVTTTRTGGERNVILVRLGVNVHERIVVKRTVVLETSPTQERLVAVHGAVSGESRDVGSVDVLDKVGSCPHITHLLELLDQFLHGSIVWILISNGLENY